MAATRNSSSTQIRRGGLIRQGFASAAPPLVTIDPRTGYDFIISICGDCGEIEDLLPEDRRWLEDSRAAVVTEMGTNPFPESCSGPFSDACAGFAIELGRMMVDRPDIRTARDVVAAVDGLPDDELLEILAGELLEDPELGDITRRAMNGDNEAFGELQATLDHHKGHPVMTSMADLAPDVRRVLHAWLPRFEAVEERVGRMLDRDIADRRKDDAASDPIGFVERATNGIRLVPDQRTRRIVLAPSYFSRPYNELLRIGDAQLLCYPIADSSLGAADKVAPPAATVRLYRALGDGSRLRILRLLAERDRYLTEIANELNLSKPTIKHHLALLRAAGLVTLTEQGNLTYYSLRHDRADEAGVELRAYLSH